MKTMISNLPVDLLEDILSRVLLKSIGAVRSTCKNWNLLSKDERFANKHIEKTAAPQRDKEVLVITVNTKDHLTSVKFYDFHNKNFDPSVNRNGILSIRENSDQVVSVHHVFYCNGLLLCLCRHTKCRLVVCNPYWGKRRWIKNPTRRSYEMFAFGYDKSCRTHKILRLSSDDNIVIHIDIYNLSCDSWKTPDEAFHSSLIEYKKPGVSLKGNTYWLAKDRERENCYLLCFDFTSERFVPRLPLPFDLTYGCNVSLSSVKEEKLAVLFKPCGGIVETIDVWVTDKIEPDAVSWSKLFKFETFKLNCRSLFGSFLIDEESKTFVIFDNCVESFETYIINWESGHFRKAESIEAPHSRLDNLVGCYVPSSMQI